MESKIKKKILVANNEFHVAQVVAIKFRNNGYVVHIAQNVKEALDMAIKHEPDIIIAEAEMPSVSGLDLVKKLRGSKEGGDVPVVMLTASGSKITDKVKQQLGISDCVSKPFSPRELLQKVNEVLCQAAKP
ncbi:MAG: response regulator [Sedimentisphaerales bacterium]|nr:response regulator [Sedimentisphaerales bacterium]